MFFTQIPMNEVLFHDMGYTQFNNKLKINFMSLYPGSARDYQKQSSATVINNSFFMSYSMCMTSPDFYWH